MTLQHLPDWRRLARISGPTPGVLATTVALCGSAINLMKATEQERPKVEEAQLRKYGAEFIGTFVLVLGG